MAKTDLTREIEKAIQSWHPTEVGGIKVNNFRGEHTALEVPAECGTVTGGIIDSVRVSEYFGDILNTRICGASKWRKDGYRGTIECPIGNNPKESLPHNCEHTTCRWNYQSKEGTPKILITCFEVKVSKSDFKSKHGHNFVGNQNYYVVPSELYPEIEDLVPDGVGVLIYLHKGLYVGLRTKRRSTYTELTDEEQKWLILSAMKRIRDMDYKKCQEWMDRAMKNGNRINSDHF